MPDCPLLLGHRGTRLGRGITENTIPAFDRCLEDGCQGFEFDVRRTADGSLVICHDPVIDGLEIANATAEQAKSLLSLDEVFQRYSKRAFLDIELKVPAIESELIISLTRRPPEKGYVVSSFLPQVLADLDCRGGQIPLGLISETRAQLMRWRQVPVLYVIPHFSLVTESLVKEVHDAGKLLLTWTVNDRDPMLRLAEIGTDGIISDDTKLLVETFRQSTV